MELQQERIRTLQQDNEQLHAKVCFEYVKYLSIFSSIIVKKTTKLNLSLLNSQVFRRPIIFFYKKYIFIVA